MSVPVVDLDAEVAKLADCPRYRCKLQLAACLRRQTRRYSFSSGSAGIGSDPCLAWASTDGNARPCWIGIRRMADAGAAGWSWMPCGCAELERACDLCRGERRIPVSAECRAELEALGLRAVPHFYNDPDNPDAPRIERD